MSWQPQREQPPRQVPESNYDRVRQECLRDFSQEIENAYQRGFQEAAMAMAEQGRQVNAVQEGAEFEEMLEPEGSTRDNITLRTLTRTRADDSNQVTLRRTYLTLLFTLYISNCSEYFQRCFLFLLYIII